MMIHLLLFFSLMLNLSASEKHHETETASTATTITESSLVKFDNIKSILKNDRLDEFAKVREQKIKKADEDAKKKKRSLYDFPQEGEFWKFFAHYWLAKNGPLLEWDFVKPDFGLDEYFGEFLKKMGFLNIRFNVLILNTPTVTHVGLPYGDDYLFLLSLPFIRTMDLSKTEIALLLFEDFIRVRKGYFKQAVENKELKELFAKNFEDKKDQPTKLFKALEESYSKQIMEKGFSFDQQFAVTTEIDLLLKKDLTLWNGYLGLVTKIKDLVANNALYTKYAQLYPSPSLQISWLVPPKKEMP